MNVIKEWFCIPKNHFRFKPYAKIEKYATNFNYQLVEFSTAAIKKTNHYPLAILFHPITFEQKYQEHLNKNKKIILVGPWHEMKYYYHYLRFHNYKVYLLKHFPSEVV